METDPADTAQRIESHLLPHLFPQIFPQIGGGALTDFSPTKSATKIPTKVWVGFSGGIDSTALLIACHQIVARHNSSINPSIESPVEPTVEPPAEPWIEPPIEIGAIHINHGLHESADAWARHCAAVCQSLDVDLHIANVEVSTSGNLEANARAARYEVFASQISAGELLLLGHHQQDQTETVLYRLFQGRGLLPMRRAGALGEGWFARPLLAVSRDVLAAYVTDNNLPWVEDDSNADVRLTRNFLRHKVIPELSRRWQDLHRSVQRVAAKHIDTQAALEDALTRLPDKVAFDALPLAPMPRQAWLRAYLAGRQVYEVSDKALAEFDAQLAKGGHASLSFGSATGPAMLRGYAGDLYFEPVQAIEVPPQSLVLRQEVRLAFGTLSLQQADAECELAFVYPGPLQVRYRVGGERLRVAPGGLTKTLKQVLAEAQVPPWQRPHYPLLYDGDELCCVPGLVLAVRTDHTKAALGENDTFCVAVWQAD